jgi:hypothetical protein
MSRNAAGEKRFARGTETRTLFVFVVAGHPLSESQ